MHGRPLLLPGLPRSLRCFPSQPWPLNPELFACSSMPMRGLPLRREAPPATWRMPRDSNRMRRGNCNLLSLAPALSRSINSAIPHLASKSRSRGLLTALKSPCLLLANLLQPWASMRLPVSRSRLRPTRALRVFFPALIAFSTKRATGAPLPDSPNISDSLRRGSDRSTKSFHKIIPKKQREPDRPAPCHYSRFSKAATSSKRKNCCGSTCSSARR